MTMTIRKFTTLCRCVVISVARWLLSSMLRLQQPLLLDGFWLREYSLHAKVFNAVHERPHLANAKLGQHVPRLPARELMQVVREPERVSHHLYSSKGPVSSTGGMNYSQHKVVCAVFLAKRSHGKPIVWRAQIQSARRGREAAV